MMSSRYLPLSLLGAVSCGRVPAALDTHGPASTSIAKLFWFFLAATLVPAAVTIGILLYATLRRGHTTTSIRAQRYVAIGAGLSSAIVIAMFIASVLVGRIVAEPRRNTDLTIDVRGHQFWWEVAYPDHQIVTANEIHLPIGRPVRLRLTSADVVHNFWVPELGGKRDMMPGHTNLHWIQADRPGVFLGRCAEYCGLQHALMAFVVVAEPEEAFAAWLDAHRAPANLPENPLHQRGLRVFYDAQCGHCHVIQGVTPPVAMGAVGPDLTHLADRRTLAAAVMPNALGNLAGWILGPHDHKPGNRMPPSEIAPDDLHALLAYLESLR